MKNLIISLKIFLFFTVLTGIVYPLLVTCIAQAAFHEKANGSLIVFDNRTVGSRLIGQQFDSAVYFSSRPSAVSYNPLPSGGSNYGLSNARLRDLVEERRRKFISLNQPDSSAIVPSEMLFASASGIDPHISQNAALLQVDRIAKARKLNTSEKQSLVNLVVSLTADPQFSILGEKRVNVLMLNLELDRQNQIIKK
jgi:potassium-transporting ATPase KdpC subunit